MTHCNDRYGMQIQMVVAPNLTAGAVEAARAGTRTRTRTRSRSRRSLPEEPAGKFFVDSSGQVLAKITNVGAYSGVLFARDSVGAEIQVHQWDFDVVAPPAASTNHNSSGGSIAAAVLGGVLLFTFVVVFVIKRQAYKLKMRSHDFQDELVELQISIQGGRVESDGTVRTKAGTRSITQAPREIKRECVTRSERIGRGQFGEVFKGVLDESGYELFLFVCLVFFCLYLFMRVFFYLTELLFKTRGYCWRTVLPPLHSHQRLLSELQHSLFYF